MDLLMAVIVYLLSRIIENWSTTWQVRVLLLVVLLILALFGIFGATALWPHGSPARLR